mmetsp:Transcript_26284/g.44341  ORF Transcript_26284/g.44341 Transcript_26284/m.44341 type:complete len:249 (+) Transcript_26284:1335-2081(+)
MNQTYFDMIQDLPLLSASCRLGASTMEESFKEISANALNIIDFARCPHINRMYTQLVLDGFCADSYSGFYNIHVSHLTTLIIFFCLMVNASLLYPHFKGQTLKHLCWCCYTKEQLDEADARMAEQQGDDAVYISAHYDKPYSDYEEEEDEDEESGGARVHLVPVPTTDPDAMNNLELISMTNPAIESSVDLSGGYGGEPNSVFTFVNPSYGNGGRLSPKSNRSKGDVVRVKADEGPSYVLGDDNDDVY